MKTCIAAPFYLLTVVGLLKQLRRRILRGSAVGSKMDLPVPEIAEPEVGDDQLLHIIVQEEVLQLEISMNNSLEYI